MRLIDKTPKISRRTLLRTGSMTAAAVAVVPASAITGKAWAAAPVAVSAETFATLVKLARDIYPHDKLGDQHYGKVMEGLDAAAKDDPAAKALLEEGVAALNSAAIGMKYASYNGVTDEKERVAILKDMEATPFFQKVRGSLVTGIYNNPEVWKVLGYEGESASQGGYINRGFDDIDWLSQG
jgi:hypothetical protein